jgi:hypothetical protein
MRMSILILAVIRPIVLHTTAPYLCVVYRVSRLAQDSPFAGCTPDLVGWRHKASQIRRGRSRVDLTSPCYFLLASIRTDPCRRLRLGPLRYRAHGLMLLLPFVLPPSRRDAKRHPHCFCSLIATQMGHVKNLVAHDQIRGYKPPIARQTRNNGNLTIAEARTSKSFIFSPGRTRSDLARLRLASYVPFGKKSLHHSSKRSTSGCVHPPLHIRPYTNSHQVEKYAQPPRYGKLFTRLQIFKSP